MPDNKLTVGFEYRYKLIKEIVPENAKEEDFGDNWIDELALKIKTKSHIYWFILTGSTGTDFIYKLVHKVKRV